MQHHRDYVKERKTNYDDDDDGAATSAKAKQLFILYSQFVFYSVYLVFTFFCLHTVFSHPEYYGILRYILRSYPGVY